MKRDKAVPIGLNDADSDLLTAIQGGTTVEVLSIPRDYSVTPVKTDFVKESPNLFDKSTAMEGYTVDIDGTLIVSVARSVSDFIQVKGNTPPYSASHQAYIKAYNENKEPLSGGLYTLSPYNLPSSARYVRVSFETININTFQFEEGNSPTEFMNFGEIAIPKLKNTLEDLLTDENEEWGVA